MPFKQCTKLICKESFSFKINGKGHTITFKEKQEFWITNTETDQVATNDVMIARKGANMIQAYPFSPSQTEQYFKTS